MIKKTKELDPEVIIKAEGITKVHRTVVSLKNISLEIRKGETVGIIGANGAGKTTFVETVIGLQKPTSGELTCFGTKDIADVKGKFGIQFQSSIYPNGVTLIALLRFYVSAFNISKEEVNSYVSKIMHDFDLTNYQNRLMKSLSGGQQQRVNVALALIHKPEVLILDELATGLDLGTKLKLLEYVKRYIENTNITLIMISHNMYELEELCDKIYVFSFGEIALKSTKDEIVKKHGSLQKFMIGHLNREQDLLKQQNGLPPNLTNVGKAILLSKRKRDFRKNKIR